MGFGMVKRDTRKAFKFFKKAAIDWRNRVAQYMLGVMYCEGVEGAQDDENNAPLGSKCLVLAVQSGWSHAIIYHASLFLKAGHLEGAIMLYEEVAKKDDNEHGLVEDGPVYLFGNKQFLIDLNDVSEQVATLVEEEATKVHLSLALRSERFSKLTPNSFDYTVQKESFWNEMTNKKSSCLADAQFNLGTIYLSGGIDVAINSKEAFYWIKKAAKNGNANACFLTGLMHEREKNYTEAMVWYMKANTGCETDPEAPFRIGLLYFHGKEIKKDYKKALFYLEAVKEENIMVKGVLGQMFCIMGEIYAAGEHGVKQDHKKAIELYTKAVDHGFGRGATSIALCYISGEQGVPKDETKQFEWLLKGSAMQCSFAKYCLANMYFNGYKGTVDLDKALDLYKIALEAGISEAQIMIDKVLAAKAVINEQAL